MLSIIYCVKEISLCRDKLLNISWNVKCFPQGLRDCCRSIRIGKILVESDADTHEARVVYAKFPDDISERKVLLMYPIMSKFLKIFIL